MAPFFELTGGVCGYGSRRVLEQVDFSLSPGEVLCILGPNGVGKSTLFKSILRLIPLLGGTLRIRGEDISHWSRARVAQSIGYIPQSTTPPFSYSVMDVVLMGRTAHLGFLKSPSEEDEALACQAIEKLGIEKLMNRRFLELSGGERQMVLIARALTQEPEILIMDEPTAALDFGNQQMVLNQIHLLAEQGLGIVMASHFPDHAFLYAHQALLLKDGGVFARGTPRDIITEDSLRELYGVDTKIIESGIRSRCTGTEIRTCIPL